MLAWVKQTRPGSHFEIGEVSNVQRDPSHSRYKFDLTVTDKNTGQVIKSHEDLPLSKDGAVIYVSYDKMTPLGYERTIAAMAAFSRIFPPETVTVLDVSHEMYCGYSDDTDDNTFECDDEVVFQRPGDAKSDMRLVGYKIKWNGKDWVSTEPESASGGAAASEPPLVGYQWINDQRRLSFASDGTLVITDNSGDSVKNKWQDGGNSTVLIQYPGMMGMSGQYIEQPGPVARCPYKLTAQEFTIVDCAYYRLIGTYHH